MTDEEACRAYCSARGWRFFRVKDGKCNYAAPGVFTLMPLYFDVSEAHAAIVTRHTNTGEEDTGHG